MSDPYTVPAAGGCLNRCFGLPRLLCCRVRGGEIAKWSGSDW